MKDKYEERYEKVSQFNDDFKALVRKYIPNYPETDFDAEFLSMLQDRTSCYSPYIWTD